jgi:hypothetical protein
MDSYMNVTLKCVAAYLLPLSHPNQGAKVPRLERFVRIVSLPSPGERLTLGPEVNNPLHLADFGAHRDCSAVEAVPAARLQALSSARSRVELHCVNVFLSVQNIFS